MKISVLLMLCVVTASACAVADDFDHIQALRNIEHHAIDAAEIGRRFHIYVMLPDSYTANPERAYRTLYLLDGGTAMPTLVGLYRYLRFTEETEESIIVAISYGSDSFEGGNYRATDYTAASDEREFWGGAPEFQQFLAAELLPWIEKHYRSNADDRVLFGHSLGGQFVLHVAQTQPALFKGYIASNPALHRNLSFFLSTHPEVSSRSKLFIASASNDDPRFKVPLAEWLQYWAGVEDKPWLLNAVELADHTHVSSPPVAFWRGLLWLESTP